MSSGAFSVGAALTTLALSGCISLESEAVPKRNPDFLVVGHRGAPNEAAENTIAAYEAALALGARALEVDLCVTADGVAVIWHDRDPDDTVALARQNGLEGLLYRPSVPEPGSPLRRPVDELTLAELRASHGYTRDGARDPAAVIPTLAELLSWAAAQPELVAVYLDLKVVRAEHATAILGQVAAAGLDGVRFYAMSIRRDVVEAMLTTTPAANLRVVFDHEESGAVDRSLELGLRDLSIGLTALRSESDVLAEIDAAREARDDGRIDTITVWTIDSDMTMAVFLFHDVDAILTNEPARLDEIWRATL